jgi:hypothetical protein
MDNGDVESQAFLIRGHPPTLPGLSVEETLTAFYSGQAYLSNAQAFFTGDWTSLADGEPSNFHRHNPVVHSSLRGTVSTGALLGKCISGDLHKSGRELMTTAIVITDIDGAESLDYLDQTQDVSSHVCLDIGIDTFKGTFPKYMAGDGFEKAYIDLCGLARGDHWVAFDWLTYVIADTSMHHVWLRRWVIYPQFNAYTPSYGVSTPIASIYNVRWNVYGCKVAEGFYGDDIRQDFIVDALNKLSDRPCLPVDPNYPGPFIKEAFSTSYLPGIHLLDRSNDLAVREYMGLDEEMQPTVRGASTYSNFRQVVECSLVDLLPLSFLSSTEAVNGWVGDWRVNHVESCSDLWGLLSLVDMLQLLRAVRKISWKSASKADLLKKILHVLSDAQLLYSFALAPSLEDATKIASKAKGFASRFSGYFDRSRTVYGKAKLYHDFNGYPGCLITVRSELRVKPVPDSALCIMQAKASGLLPQMSDFWAAVPFTFLSDKLFPVGDLLSLVDSQLFLMGLEVEVGVHSVLVQFAPQQDLLSPCYESSFEDREPDDCDMQYRYYLRWVSNIIPRLVPSRILTSDLLTSEFSLDATFGALAYKLLS